MKNGKECFKLILQIEQGKICIDRYKTRLIKYHAK